MAAKIEHTSRDSGPKQSSLWSVEFQVVRLELEGSEDVLEKLATCPGVIVPRGEVDKEHVGLTAKSSVLS